MQWKEEFVYVKAIFEISELLDHYLGRKIDLQISTLILVERGGGAANTEFHLVLV